MNEWYGYAGQVLRVNLSKKKVFKESLNKEYAKLFLGGVGYAAKILWDELEHSVDPLSPENKMVFATGPLTGTLCPGSGSYEICFKSPLTNVWGESRSGGDWGPELKFAGYDILIVEGRSEEPVYIWIDNDHVEIRSAKSVWGKNVYESEEILKEEVGDKRAKVACIGPAGENLVRFASIMNDHDRAAGRTGGGAVMGSKNLKSVVVRGTGSIKVPDPDKYIKIISEIEGEVLNHPEREYFLEGTAAYMVPYDEDFGDLPTKYAQSNTWGKARTLVEKLKSYDSKFVGCFGCMIACGRHTRIVGGRWRVPVHGGPEYETLTVFSAFMDNEDIESVIMANYLCNSYGMDTISAGNVIAFLMEAYERGWVTKEQLGVDLTWGNSEAIIQLLHKIGRREEVGKLMGEGVKRVAKALGKEAEELAIHVKGLEIPMHDPRTAKNFALQYGTANRGMCHIHPHETCDIYHDPWFVESLRKYGVPEWGKLSEYEESGVAWITKLLQDIGIISDILGTCKFHVWTGMTLDNYARVLNSTVGWELTDNDLIMIGERVSNLQRAFNVREGVTRKDDMLPKRIREIPKFGKWAKPEAAIVHYEQMLDEYYVERGWDEDGIPTRRKLEELGLADVADELEKRGD